MTHVRSFATYWTTLKDQVPVKSARWCCKLVSRTATEFWDNLCMFTILTDNIFKLWAPFARQKCLLPIRWDNSKYCLSISPIHSCNWNLTRPWFVMVTSSFCDSVAIRSSNRIWNFWRIASALIIFKRLQLRLEDFWICKQNKSTSTIFERASSVVGGRFLDNGYHTLWPTSTASKQCLLVLLVMCVHCYQEKRNSQSN